MVYCRAAAIANSFVIDYGSPRNDPIYPRRTCPVLVSTLTGIHTGVIHKSAWCKRPIPFYTGVSGNARQNTLCLFRLPQQSLVGSLLSFGGATRSDTYSTNQIGQRIEGRIVQRIDADACIPSLIWLPRDKMFPPRRSETT